MDLQITVEQLQKRSLFIATPMYGGACGGQYTKCIEELTSQLVAYGIPHRVFFLFNESLITRARNYIADEFLRSEMSHLMFIDSDIGFKTDDVIAMLAMADPEDENYDILCGPYPKKTIAWEKIRAAVNKGLADENPNVLENFVGDYVVNPVQDKVEFRLDEPVEVMEGGTGFMMIQRRVFEKFKEHYPELSYKPDHIRTKHFDGSREIHAYFDALIDNKYSRLRHELEAFLKQGDKTADDVVDFVLDPVSSATGKRYSKRYLSEDYMFCQFARNIGMKVWLCPWMQLSHMGMYMFGGSLAALAHAGVTATADPAELKKVMKPPKGPSPGPEIKQ